MDGGAAPLIARSGVKYVGWLSFLLLSRTHRSIDLYASCYLICGMNMSSAWASYMASLAF